MEFEPIEDFEQDLRQALQRHPAPPSLKRKVMERRRTQAPHRRTVTWQRLAASLALAAVVAGGFAWRDREERRKGEAARQQVLTALRVTGHALNQMNAQLEAHGRAAQE